MNGDLDPLFFFLGDVDGLGNEQLDDLVFSGLGLALGVDLFAEDDLVVGVDWFYALQVYDLSSTKKFNLVLINLLRTLGVVNIHC